MMVSISAESLKTINNIFSEYGKSITFRIEIINPINKDNPGQDPGSSTINITTQGYMYNYEDRYVDNSTILEGDKKLVLVLFGMSVANIEAIKPDNFIVFGTTVYSIITAKIREIEGVPISAICQLRGIN